MFYQIEIVSKNVLKIVRVEIQKNIQLFKNTANYFYFVIVGIYIDTVL